MKYLDVFMKNVWCPVVGSVIASAVVWIAAWLLATS
jgi:hypothetical protein